MFIFNFDLFFQFQIIPKWLNSKKITALLKKNIKKYFFKYGTLPNGKRTFPTTLSEHLQLYFKKQSASNHQKPSV